MKIDQKALEDLMVYKINKNTKDLYKFMLDLLQEIEANRYVIDAATYENLRKKILDQGNAAIRDNELFIKKFDFSLK